MFKSSSFTSSDLKHTCIKFLLADEVESVTSNSSEMRTKCKMARNKYLNLSVNLCWRSRVNLQQRLDLKTFIGSIYLKINYPGSHHLPMSGSKFLQKQQNTFSLYPTKLPVKTVYLVHASHSPGWNITCLYKQKSLNIRLKDITLTIPFLYTALVAGPRFSEQTKN